MFRNFQLITPPEITPAVLDFAGTLGGSAPDYIAIQPEPFAKTDECHNNVAEMIRQKGGNRVLGWSIWTTKTLGWLEAVLHCVWTSPTGMIDITPDPDGEVRRLFAIDRNAEFHGHAVKKFRLLSSEPRVVKAVDLFIRATAIQNSIPDGQVGSHSQTREYDRLTREAMRVLHAYSSD